MDTLTDLQVVARSGNAKTGPIPVTYRPERTCEPTCPLLRAGCYGTGRIFASAERHAKTVTRDDVAATLRKASPTARFLRDRVVGDVVTVDASGVVTFDLQYVETIGELAADAGLRAFGYSHAWRRMSPADVAAVAASGYVLNASCETVGDVADAIALGLPATIANDDVAEGTIINDRRVVTCPAQTRDDVTCASCGLCARPERKSVVRFRIHGTARRKAAASVAARMAADAAGTDGES